MLGQKQHGSGCELLGNRPCLKHGLGSEWNVVLQIGHAVGLAQDRGTPDRRAHGATGPVVPVEFGENFPDLCVGVWWWSNRLRVPHRDGAAKQKSAMK